MIWPGLFGLNLVEYMRPPMGFPAWQNDRREHAVHVGRAENNNSTYSVLSSRVELTSSIAILDVDLGLVDKTGDHGVIGRIEDLETLEGTVEHDTGTMALFRAPSNLLALSVGDGRVGSGRSPQTEIYKSKMKSTMRKR